MPFTAIGERWVPVRRKGCSSLFVCIFYTDGYCPTREVFKPCRSRTTDYAAGAAETSGHDPRTVLVHLALAGCIVRSVGRSPSICSSSLPVASVLGGSVSIPVE